MKNSYILISGKKRSGKDTLGQMLVKTHQGCQTFSFAFPIKHTLIPVANYFSLDVENSEPDKEIFRPVMQVLGQVMRKVNKDFWVDFAYKNTLKNEVNNIFINTDTRFENEIGYFKELKNNNLIDKLVTIRINNDTDVITDNDISETNLDNYSDFDIVINKSDYFYYDQEKKKYVPNFDKLERFCIDFWKKW